MEALDSWRPQPTLRQKVDLDVQLTDRQLFASLELGDVWADAKLPAVYWYLRNLNSLSVPDSWEREFSQLDDALKGYKPS